MCTGNEEKKKQPKLAKLATTAESQCYYKPVVNDH